MGSLRHSRSPRTFTLAGRTIVGRSPTVDCVLSSSRVSGEHARIWWEGGAWWLRDLGSRNGTTLDGERVSGRATRLTPGARLTFGDPRDVWVWMDDDPPVVVARAGEIEAVGGADLLALPSEQNVEATLLTTDGESWWLETDRGMTLVEAGQSIAAGGLTWRVFLPLELERTRTTLGATSEPPAEGAAWRAEFAVSSDQEFAQLVLVDPAGSSVSLTPRVFHYTLLTLARLRLEDGGDETSGWRYVDDLCRSLRITRAELNQHVYRARKQVRARRGLYAPELVERPQLSDQLRFALADITVHTD